MNSSTPRLTRLSITLLKRHDIVEYDFGFIIVLRQKLYQSIMISPVILSRMNEELFMQYSISMSESHIYMESTFLMDENQRRHGSTSSLSMNVSRNKQTYTEIMVNTSSGEEILTVHIKQLILRGQKKMMGKYDFIHWSELGSIVW